MKNEDVKKLERLIDELIGMVMDNSINEEHDKNIALTAIDSLQELVE